MHTSTSTFSSTIEPPPEYEAAMADIEQRAIQGRLTLAQARYEIFTLRERFACKPGTVMQWAAASRS